MKNTTSLSTSLFLLTLKSSRPHRRSRGLLLAATMLLLLLATQSFAGSATWKTSPGSGDWNTASNWTPSTIPNGSSDTATFDISNQTSVSMPIPNISSLSGIVFNPGASAFTITPNTIDNVTLAIVNIYGAGITNNSGTVQLFTNTNFELFWFFNNRCAAGDMVTYTWYGGGLCFYDRSSGGHATFNNNVASLTFSDSSTAAYSTIFNNGGGRLSILSTATADHATITNNGTSNFFGFAGHTMLRDTAHGADATFTATGSNFVNGGGFTQFLNLSAAERAVLIASGGTVAGGMILFGDDSTGGKSRVEVFGNGFLDISSHLPPRVTIGSIEGTGAVFLGANNLSVGSNSLSTTFSGAIKDGGSAGGIGGSLAKIGTGRLVLRNANTYTGGTTITGGKLVVNNTSGSGTGSNLVAVERGRLGGRGTIAGPVTVGTGSGPGAVLSPGNSALTRGTLTIQRTLTFNSDATYNFWLNTNNGTADKVVALGVTINNGAQFSFSDIGSNALPTGTVFTVIDNTAATSIAGTFSNLADGSTFTNNGNSYHVNYEGGTGNDLTLTVVP